MENETEQPDDLLPDEEGDIVPGRVPQPDEPVDPGVPARDDPEPVGPGA
jgi:hypothetical protein